MHNPYVIFGLWQWSLPLCHSLFHSFQGTAPSPFWYFMWESFYSLSTFTPLFLFCSMTLSLTHIPKKSGLFWRDVYRDSTIDFTALLRPAPLSCLLVKSVFLVDVIFRLPSSFGLHKDPPFFRSHRSRNTRFSLTLSYSSLSLRRRSGVSREIW